ncbi:hypothetical protein MKY27_09750 [Solibacillus sp. FSL R5-0449]|uniref:hypothetical protein n=1 Tax=Solibacillus sp. FSL R5-0449 TaxID=2921639 RepID=UPI0030CFB840
MNRNDLIIEKINKVYQSVENVGFDIALDWKSELSYSYYEGFSSDIDFIRKGSLFSFLGMVINHFYRSTLAFGPEKSEDKENGEEKILHDITIFIKIFIDNFEHLNKDFPITVFFVIKFLFLIDNTKKFEDRFEDPLYPQYFNILRKEYFSNIDFSKYKYYSEIKEELGFSYNYF